MAQLLRKPLLWLTCLLLAAALSGCNENKALALQSAAVQYRDQAVQALALTAKGIRAATAMPISTPEQLAGKLKPLDKPIDAVTLEFLLTGEAELAHASGEAARPLDELRDRVVAFSAIFDNLPKGSYLATDEVKRAIPVALRMNQSLLNVTQQIETGTLRIADNARRIEIIEDTNAAIAMTAGAQRDQALQRAARSMIELAAHERRMRSDASVSLLQAAEIGNTVIGLARNYDQVSLRDVLSTMNDALTLAGRISPESRSIQQALTRLQGTTKAWVDDPVLKPLLDQQITHNQ
jgi:hypothetical protein